MANTQRYEKAIEIYKKAFNCSQSVFTAYRQEDKLDEASALKLSTIFGGGVASTGTGLCGAVTGALMAISMKYGKADIKDNDAKLKTYELGRQFMAEFAGKNGTCVCEEILGINIGTPENMAKARQAKLFETKCFDAVKSAAKILDNII